LVDRNSEKNKQSNLDELSEIEESSKSKLEISTGSELSLEFQEVDLDKLDPDEVLGELFEKINPLTIPAVLIGVILLIISYTNILDGHLAGTLIVGFTGGLSFVFGCSELIIFAVKGIGKKLNWSQYFMGIMAAIGADSSDVVVVSILLVRAKRLIETGGADNIALATKLTSISFTLVLMTVLINTLILGVTMIVVSRRKPFKLPKELTNTESNLLLAIAMFSFIFIAFGFTHTSLNIQEFDRAFEGVMGLALLTFYIIFIGFLIGDARQKRSERVGPQILISEYFPEDENNHKPVEKEITDEVKKPHKRRFFKGLFNKNGNDEDEDAEQYVSLRRFPWYIILLAFTVGIAGIIFGGDLISSSIVSAIELYDLPILLYSVIVGFVSSAPEMTITFRALRDPERESTEIGLVHQISSVNQTFFLLFGFPLVLAAIINIDIPAALDTTLVFAMIFAISLALHLMIIDDNHFDRVEGTLILLASLTGIIALGVIGYLL